MRRQYISLSFSDVHMEMMEQLMQAKGYSSKSEVLRTALIEFYEKKLPDYIYNKSATDRVKREKLAQEKSFDQMTDLEYAKTFNGAEVITNRQGKDIFVMLTLGNSVRGIPVDGMKKWKGNPVFEAGIEGHDQQVAMGASVLERIKGDAHFYQKFDKEYDIDLKSFFNEPDDNADSGLSPETESPSVEE